MTTGGIAFDNGESGWGYGDKVASQESFIRRYDAITSAGKALPNVCGYCCTQATDHCVKAGERLRIQEK